METCSIAETFRNGTVLITGSTGFLGKMLMEKLLRSCPVKCVVIMARSKKGIDANRRVAEMCEQVIFDRLRTEQPNFIDCIKIIEGNLEDSSTIGSSDDREWMMKNVNFVFHCAASVKFNEPLEFASKINIQGTANMLALATRMKHLKGFVHVSTAFSHCPRSEIKEQYYPVPVTADGLKHIIDSGKLRSSILENWPNTYTFTKAVAENLVSINGRHLPISVYRPSIILCTKSEPEAGWFDGINGPTGIIAGIITGVIRTFSIVKHKTFDGVPADYAINALISVMWDTVSRYKEFKPVNHEEPKIYNFVSSAESPLTWNRFIDEITVHYYEVPPLQSFWYGFYIAHANRLYGGLLIFLLHKVPAAFVDLFLMLNRKRPKMLRMYGKIDQMMNLYYPFTTRQWTFDNSNTRNLWSSLSQEDRDTFWFSIDGFDWNSYLKTYYHGIMKHFLREEKSNALKAKAKNLKLYWLHQFSIFVITYLMGYLGWMFVKHLF